MHWDPALPPNMSMCGLHTVVLHFVCVHRGWGVSKCLGACTGM